MLKDILCCVVLVFNLPPNNTHGKEVIKRAIGYQWGDKCHATIAPVILATTPIAPSIITF